MKKIKIILMVVLLIGLMALSTLLCACNKDAQPTGDNDTQPSGSIEEQPSGEVIKNEVIEPYSLALAQNYYKNSDYYHPSNPHITEYFVDESKRNLTAKIDSVDELKTFCEEKQLQVFNVNDNTYKNDRLSKKLREYDEDFFKSRSIALVFRFVEAEDYYVYDSVDIKDGIMTVNLITANNKAETQTRTQAYVFELNKNTANEVNQINVQENIGELDKEMNIKIYDGDYLYLKEHAGTSVIINSYEELLAICNIETSQVFRKVILEEIVPEEKLDDEEFCEYWYQYYSGRNKRIIDILNMYDEEFFEENSLVLSLRYRGNNRFYTVKGFDVDNNVLNITLSTPNLNGAYPMLDALHCAYIFEIEKEKVTSVTQIKVQEIEE